MNNQTDAKEILKKSWPYIVRECRQVLGSELHYQAMIYHCLRQTGKVPIDQIGMNVKMWIDHPKTKLFRMYDGEKHPDFQGGFEPIPDVVLFKPSINRDWRRRNHENTLRKMLMTIEVKASERNEGRMMWCKMTSCPCVYQKFLIFIIILTSSILGIGDALIWNFAGVHLFSRITIIMTIGFLLLSFALSIIIYFNYFQDKIG
ncbi:hypothetical protein [uncultured Methanoregula sp.]|uniref:hypothetical protein n=1 Tax=uncultured Methanoregula sp. TaxID=1005933 RepID=UPI002AAB2A27|nr:hypothetical protein [uncultured Methanoregula sp.]